MKSWLDSSPPDDPSLAEAYWCYKYFFLHNTELADYTCQCRDGMGHNDKKLYEKEMKPVK